MHLTIPIDVQEQSVEEDDIVFIKPEEYRPQESASADAELVRRAVALPHEACRPLAIAGCAAGYTLSGDALRRFVETTRVPVVTEEQSRGLISDDHPYAFGFFERGLNRAAAKVRDADVVVLLGRKQDFTLGFCRPLMSQPTLIKFYRDNREFALKVTADFAKNNDAGVLNASYESVIRFQDKTPYVNPKGIDFILEVIEDRDPRAKTFDPQSVVDSSFIQELNKSGFIDALWRK